MEQKFDDFSIQEAMRMAKSPAGQRLMELLRSSDAPELRQAMDQASAGDYVQAKPTLSGLLASPEVQALLKQMQG